MTTTSAASSSPKKVFRPGGGGEQIGPAAGLVLVVDDTEANQYAMARVLRGAGYEVVTVNTGREALALARERKPAVVVLDVLLPDITGWDVCARLKRDPATAVIPVLQVSARYTSDHDHARGLDEGADSYLVQPIDPAVLLATVNALLRLNAAHAALRRSEERLRTVLSNAPIVLFAVDRNGTYTLFAGNGFDRVNVSPESMVGQSLYVLHAGDRRFLDNATSALAGNAFVDALPLHGRWFEIRYNPIHDAHSQPDGFVAVGTDITDRRKAELARQDLLAIVAHDLRSPLTGIQLNITLLERIHSGAARLPVSAEDVLKTMRRSAKRAEGLITDLLDHAQMESGTFAVARARQDLEPLLREAVDVMLPIAREKGVRIALDIAGPAVIECDGARLLQAVGNLIENALKFSPSPGGLITVRSIDEPAGITIVVEDNGAGIAAADLPHLFNRFWQGGANRKPGAGLGLSIVDGIVRAHGGRIRAENRPEAGARFCIVLPK